MNIFILGSCGFIGSHCCDYFLQEGHTVTGCDLVEYSTSKYTYHKVSILSFDFETLFTTDVFDVCINASGSGNVGYSMAHPQSDFDCNTVAVAKVLDTIRKYQPGCRLLHISSAAVYGNPVTLPVNEKAAVMPLSPYGFHKHMSEIICREYNTLFDIKVVIIRPFSVYGCGLKKQLLWDICQKLKQHNSIELFGDGTETRDFIHIDDLVKLMNLIIQHVNFDGKAYNAATGVAISISEVAEIFMKHFPGNKKIEFSGKVKAGDPSKWQADISSVEAIGFAADRSMDAAIQEYIHWFSTAG